MRLIEIGIEKVGLSRFVGSAIDLLTLRKYEIVGKNKPIKSLSRNQAEALSLFRATIGESYVVNSYSPFSERRRIAMWPPENYTAYLREYLDQEQQ